ncbi:D-glycerate 3-kinase-like protein [Aulographum hederae CBS 113979]|uniref:D-glycerate 3-kinase-like protein n=1 Tax=Aulographum hederae CBS 113979 TaxID=1176131 RepID=A0A6G1H0P4_9PEZI|nr:D-glycerate 3-kinase-like protein [Aulographum hederae CBS 113979]
MPIPKEIIDSVLERIIPRIVSNCQKRISGSNTSKQLQPFVLGLTGLQGSGKSTWTSRIHTTLRDTHGFKVVSVSLDDFYLNHDNLVRLRESNSDNLLLRTRGQPGSHDEALAQSFFDSLTKDHGTISIPAFDKSCFNGEGDRVPTEQWERIDADPPVDVVVFEGWCIGFRPLSDDGLDRKWKTATSNQQSNAYVETKFSTTTLANHSLEALRTINENLRRYCGTFMGPQHFDYLVHLDTDDLKNVYQWRMQQEHALRAAKKGGMTDDEVCAFVQGYMPSYELYLDQLREGFFVDEQSGEGQLRVLLAEDRSVKSFQELGG